MTILALYPNGPFDTQPHVAHLQGNPYTLRAPYHSDVYIGIRPHNWVPDRDEVHAIGEDCYDFNELVERLRTEMRERGQQ